MDASDTLRLQYTGELLRAFKCGDGSRIRSEMESTTSEVKCALLWKLCRKHGWGAPIPERDLVDLALRDSDQGIGKRVVEELVREPYVEYTRGRGYRLKNDPDAQAQAAVRLRTSCGYLALQIEATLSRFQQAGGFEAYDEETVRGTLDDWD